MSCSGGAGIPRRVAAHRNRLAAQRIRRQLQQPADRRVGTVGADHDPALEIRARVRRRPGSTVSVRIRRCMRIAPRAVAASTSRASNTSRGMQYAASRGSATISRPSGLRSRSRPTGSKSGRGVGHSERFQHVQRLRRNSVAARLVSRKGGGIDERNPRPRVGLQRGKRGRTPGRAGADDDEVVPTRAPSWPMWAGWPGRSGVAHSLSLPSLAAAWRLPGRQSVASSERV